MKLIESQGNWYWVNPQFPDNPLSPIFFDSPPALQWRARVGSENLGDIDQLQKELDDLNSGVRVVLPKSKEHAEAMLQVATLALSNFR